MVAWRNNSLSVRFPASMKVEESDTDEATHSPVRSVPLAALLFNNIDRSITRDRVSQTILWHGLGLESRINGRP